MHTIWSKQNQEKQRAEERSSGSEGKMRPISPDEVYPGPSHYPESLARPITPSGTNALRLSLKPPQNLYAASSCLREWEREGVGCVCAMVCVYSPSCNVNINIHGAIGACRCYRAGVKIWQRGCVSRRGKVFVCTSVSGCTRKRSPRISLRQRSPVTLWCHRHTS